MNPGSASYTRTELVTQVDGGETGLARVLNAFGPLAIIIDASGLQLQNYKGGIYDGSGCSNAPTAGNHAALLVGLGADKQGKQYWSAAERAEKRDVRVRKMQHVELEASWQSKLSLNRDGEKFVKNDFHMCVCLKSTKNDTICHFVHLQLHASMQA